MFMKGRFCGRMYFSADSAVCVTTRLLHYAPCQKTGASLLAPRAVFISFLKLPEINPLQLQLLCCVAGDLALIGALSHVCAHCITFRFCCHAPHLQAYSCFKALEFEWPLPAYSGATWVCLVN